MATLALVPFLWGFAEAIFFFIVPDVWLTWLALTIRERNKLGMAVVWAVCGAILGGLLMYAIGWLVPSQQLVSWLDYVPGISRVLIQDVSHQIEQGGIGSVFIGIVKGIPYKLYASQWGAHHGNLGVFVLCSILARGGRFILSVVVARCVDLSARKFFVSRESHKYIIFAIFWVTFYIFYFWQYSH